ncbi:MAG: RidA family protein [Lachnospiraceae bacterium]|nr:RidA family protein [Lachnospiraceae bacterium]
MKDIIKTDKAPAAIGPYSQAVEVNGMVYTSGVIPVDPATGEIAGSTAADQAEQVFSNLKNLIEASGTTMENIVKTVVFLKDMEDFAAVNGVYAKYFPQPYPARSCVGVARLPKDVMLEVEAIAVK